MDTLTVPGTLGSLKTIAQYVMQASKAANLNKKATYKLRLATDEIATNIITHGYQEVGLNGTLILEAEIDESALTLMIKDFGVTYDPRKYHTPDQQDLHKNLEERPIGGLGIYLALEGLDEFHYEQLENCNRNTLVMHR